MARAWKQRDAIPIWQPLPRPRQFPEDPRLDRLLDSNYARWVGYFELRLWRREARDLRKGLFGPKGVRDVPQGEGVRTFDLPKGWTLRLMYDVPPTDWGKPGNVVAEFIPPATRRRPPNSPQRPGTSVERVQLVAAVGEPG